MWTHQCRGRMTRIAKKRNMWWFRGEAKVDGVLVCGGCGLGPGAPTKSVSLTVTGQIESLR